MIRCLLFLGCLFFVPLLQAQNPYIKYVDEVNFDRDIRIKGTADGGFAVFSPDSFKVYKFNPCGVVQWARQFTLPVTPYIGLDFFIATRMNGCAFFSIETRNGIRGTRLVTLDSTGQVLWSRFIRDNLYEQTTYSLDQDKAGNFMVYANASRIGGGEVYNMITKIDENGTLVWTRFYNHGGIWGGALFTEDQGILARTGNILFKTDGSGEVQWTCQVGSSAPTYFRPVEVTDGYIITGKNYAGKIFLAKITKSGLPAFANFQLMPSTGNVPFLHKMANGHFGLFMNLFVGTMSLPVLMEYNADMQLVKSRSLYRESPFLDMVGMDMDIGPDQRPLVAGAISIGDFAFIPNVFYAKPDTAFQSGCDTAFLFQMEDGGGDIVNGLTTSFLHPLVVESLETSALHLHPEIFTLCGQLPPLQLSVSGDSTLCSRGTAHLSVGKTVLFDRYLWSTGETTSSITVSQPGTYWVTGTNLCRGESASDTIEVSLPTFPGLRFPADTNLCLTDSIRYDVYVEGATYHWQDGSRQPYFVAKQAGKVEVAIALGNCSLLKKGTVQDCELLEIPSLFTPNDDGHNDHFVARRAKGITVNHLDIFNRWGKQVHSSTDFIKAGWDGDGSSEGIYFWKLNYTNFRGEKKERTGTVALVKG